MPNAGGLACKFQETHAGAFFTEKYEKIVNMANNRISIGTVATARWRANERDTAR